MNFGFLGVGALVSLECGVIVNIASSVGAGMSVRCYLGVLWIYRIQAKSQG